MISTPTPPPSVDTTMQIEYLRRQLAELQSMEYGQQEVIASPDVELEDEFVDDDSAFYHPVSKPVYPPAPPRKDFTLQEVPSNVSTGRRHLPRKLVAWVVGLFMVTIVAIGLAKLVSYMQTNDVQFTQDSPGTTPITLATTALHNTPNDCWVIYHGNVYDMTNYAKRHPAGPGWITASCGTDGTSEYARFHSQSLLRSVRGEMLGPLVSDDTMEPPPGGDNGGNPPMDETEPPTTGDDCSTVQCVTQETLALHNTENDCWVVFHGDVYDVTNYAPEHPAGAIWITDWCGMDGTSEYARFHGISLLRLIEDSIQGRYVVEESPTMSPTTGDNANQPTESPTGDQGVECPEGNCVRQDELALHNTPNDCWVAFHGDVYDMATYAPKHPAGANWITGFCGQDGTTSYARYHSEALLRVVDKHILGRLLTTNGDNPTDGGADQEGTVVDCSVISNCVTQSDLARHNSANDCWVVYHGNAYVIMTTYAGQHPAGKRWIVASCGMDGTNEYGRFHSPGLLRSIANNLVGPLEGSIIGGPDQGGWDDDESSPDED